MSLEGLKESLQKKGYDDARAILESAKAEIVKMVAAADAEAKEIRERAKKEAKERADAEYTKEISSSKLSVKRDLLSAKKEILQDVLETATKHLGKMREKKEYSDFLARAILKGAERIESPSFIVYVNEDDIKRAGEVIKKRKITAEIRDTEIAGGAIITTPDESISIDLSLEKLLVDAYNNHLKEVSEMLFEK